MTRIRLISGHDTELADWVASRVPWLGFADGRPFDPCTCIGVLRGDQLIAAVVYHGWQPQWRHIQVSMAADDPSWCIRGVVQTILSYPFSIGCQRINAVTLAKNTRVNKMLTGLRFVREGTHVDFFGYGKTAYSWRMMEKEYNLLLQRFGFDEREVDGRRWKGRKQREAA